jgi:hypothetical protein
MEEIYGPHPVQVPAAGLWTSERPAEPAPAPARATAEWMAESCQECGAVRLTCRLVWGERRQQRGRVLAEHTCCLQQP